MNSHEQRLEYTDGEASPIVINKLKFGWQYIRSRVRALDSGGNETRNASHEGLAQVNRIKVEKQSLWKAITSPLFGGMAARYNMGDQGITIREPRFGSEAMRQRAVNRRLIHETTHAADHKNGDFDKLSFRVMNIISDLGSKAIGMNIAMYISTAIPQINQDSLPFLIPYNATYAVGLVGLLAYRLNPAERRARAAERLYYNPDEPLATIVPLEETATGSTETLQNQLFVDPLGDA